jgi:hypothetical protein
MDTSQIKEHMEIVGSDGQHVGTVDRVDGQRIKLTRKDASASGEHQYVGLDAISGVTDGRIRLNCTAEQARQSSGG